MNKCKSEITKLNEIKSKQLDEITSLKTEISQKERTIKQLQLSEQSISHDYETQIEKLEAKLKVIKLINYRVRKRILIKN